MHKCDADGGKAREIRRLLDDQEKLERDLHRQGQLEIKAEQTKTRQREKSIAGLEKEVSRLTRKLNVSEADKNKLTSDLNTLQSADSWSRRSPTKAPAGIGTPMRTPGSAARPRRTPASTPRTPYTPQKPKTILEKKVENDRALRELNGKLALLQKENRALKTKMVAAPVVEPKSDRADKLAKQNAQLSGHARRLTAKTRTLETELSSLKSGLAQASEERDRYKAGCTKAQGEARAARSAAARAKSVAPGSISADQYESLNQQRLQAEAAMSDQTKIVEKLKHDLKLAKQQVRESAGRQESDEKRAELDAQVQILNVEYTKLQQKFAALAHRNSIRKNQDSQTKQIQAERDEYKEKAATVSAQIEDLKTNLVTSESQCAAAQRQVSTLTVSLEKSKTSGAKEAASGTASQTKLAGLESDLAAANKDRDALKSQLESKADAGMVTGLQEQLAAEQQVVKALKNEIVTLQNRVATTGQNNQGSEPDNLEAEADQLIHEAQAAAQKAAKQRELLETQSAKLENENSQPKASKSSDALAQARARNKARKEAEKAAKADAEKGNAEAEVEKASKQAKEDARLEAEKAKATQVKEQQLAAEELARADARAAKERAEKEAVDRKAATEKEAAAKTFRREQAAKQQAAEQAAVEKKTAVLKAKEEAASKREKAKKEAAAKAADKAKQEEVQRARDEAAQQEAQQLAAAKKEEQRRAEKAANQAEEERRKAAEKQEQEAEAARQEEATRQAEEAAAQAQQAQSQDDVEVRYFKALYDYDPAESSPNDPDDEDEELTLREGDIVRIFGEMEDDGFYMGEHVGGDYVGHRGVVPSNFIEEIEGYEAPADSEIEGVENTVIGSFKVLYDYDPESQSPNDEPELELAMFENQVGDKLEEVDDTGYFKGCIDGRVGLVPSNFVEMDGEEAQDEEGDEDDAEDIEEFAVGTVVQGLYDYVPSEFSPNDEPSEELGFAAGDRMVVKDKLDEDGFYYCEHKITGQVLCDTHVCLHLLY